MTYFQTTTHLQQEYVQSNDLQERLKIIDDMMAIARTVGASHIPPSYYFPDMIRASQTSEERQKFFDVIKKISKSSPSIGLRDCYPMLLDRADTDAEKERILKEIVMGADHDPASVINHCCPPNEDQRINPKLSFHDVSQGETLINDAARLLLVGNKMHIATRRFNGHDLLEAVKSLRTRQAKKSLRTGLRDALTGFKQAVMSSDINDDAKRNQIRVIDRYTRKLAPKRFGII